MSFLWKVENFVSMMSTDANQLDLKHNEELIKTTNQKIKSKIINKNLEINVIKDMIQATNDQELEILNVTTWCWKVYKILINVTFLYFCHENKYLFMLTISNLITHWFPHNYDT